MPENTGRHPSVSELALILATLRRRRAEFADGYEFAPGLDIVNIRAPYPGCHRMVEVTMSFERAIQLGILTRKANEEKVMELDALIERLEGK